MTLPDDLPCGRYYAVTLDGQRREIVVGTCDHDMCAREPCYFWDDGFEGDAGLRSPAKALAEALDCVARKYGGIVRAGRVVRAGSGT